MASSFSRQRNPNMEKALFDWPIVLQYDVKEISRKFFGHEVCLPARSLSQPKPRCVCIRFIHQSNRSISVCLLFLFCSRVFISNSLYHVKDKHPIHGGIKHSWLHATVTGFRSGHQGHPTTVFRKRSVRRGKCCLGFSIP